MTETVEISQTAMAAAADEAATLLKALSNPARLRLLCALVPGERSVSELEAELGASQSFVSNHLSRLRAEGYVTTERSGRMIHYRIADPRVLQVLERVYEVFCPR